MNRKHINDLWQKAEDALRALYGDMPDLFILNRFYSEKMAFFGSDVIISWARVGEICREAASRNHLAMVRGTVGSCFTAYLLGATENNPLPLHYRCPKCKSTELVDNEKALPFDLPTKACACGEVMHPDGFDIPYETNLVNLRLPHLSIVVSSDFFSEAVRMVFDYPSITIVAKGNTEENARMKEAVSLAKPQTAYEMLKVLSALHGTGTWLDNAQRLVEEGVGIADIPTSRDDVFILLRDKLKVAGYNDNGIAYELTERIRHGRLDANSRLILSSLDLPEWFMDYVENIRYMFPKSHSVSCLGETLAFMRFKPCFMAELDSLIRK